MREYYLFLPEIACIPLLYSITVKITSLWHLKMSQIPQSWDFCLASCPYAQVSLNKKQCLWHNPPREEVYKVLKNDLKDIPLLTNGAKQGLAWVGNILFSSHRAQMTLVAVWMEISNTSDTRMWSEVYLSLATWRVECCPGYYTKQEFTISSVPKPEMNRWITKINKRERFSLHRTLLHEAPRLVITKMVFTISLWT